MSCCELPDRCDGDGLRVCEVCGDEVDCEGCLDCHQIPEDGRSLYAVHFSREEWEPELVPAKDPADAALRAYPRWFKRGEVEPRWRGWVEVDLVVPRPLFHDRRAEHVADVEIEAVGIHNRELVVHVWSERTLGQVTR